MKTRWALFVLGAWTMGSLCMSVVATENFYTIDRLLESSTKPEFYAAVQKLGHTPARDLLRYLSSELNRLYFQGWNVMQLLLGAAAIWLAGREPRIRGGHPDDDRDRRADARVSHAADRDARTQPRFRTARPCAGGDAEVLDSARGVHVARDAEARVGSRRRLVDQWLWGGD